MHKLESFALSCGSKISKPHIEKSFYPIKEKKFICVSRKADTSVKQYSFYDDVVFHIKPFLDKEKISIVELCDPDTPPLFYTSPYQISNILHASYILSKSVLYLGNLGIHAHIASHHGNPIVCPCNNDYVDTFKPYWSNSDNCEILVADTENKPLFAQEENPKTINNVHPETIACRILDQLNIKHDLNTIETVYTGERYDSNKIHIVPGSYNIQAMNVKGEIDLRMDKSFDLNFLAQCNCLDKINIITKKVIPKEYLNFIKDKINFINFIINKNTTLDDIQQFESTGKHLNLICEDKKSISKLRLNFIDYNILPFEPLKKKDIPVSSDKNLHFLSKRNIIHEGKVYNSFLSIDKKQNTSSVTFNKHFMEDAPFTRIFKKNLTD